MYLSTRFRIKTMNNHHQEHNHSCHEGSMHDHQSMIDDFKRRFWISSFITIPVLILSPMIQSFFGFSFDFAIAKYISFVLASIVFFYGGKPFHLGLKNELSNKVPGMMTLIALAISVAYIYSSFVIFGLKGKEFYWELTTLIDIMLLGHWIEMKSVMAASKSLEMLAKMMPSEAHLIENDSVREIKIEDLKLEDKILVKPGEKIPVDGKVYEGESYIDESMLTGESVPVKKSSGSKVIAGSINSEASLKIIVEKTGKDSYLSKVIDLVKTAQGEKSKTQRLADKAAAWLTYLSLSVGSITLVTWLVFGFDLSFAIERMVTVMVITCPHALGLAIPLVVAISTSLAASQGLLIRNRTAFENSFKITTMLFDKTGTLTKGNFAVIDYKSLDGNNSDEELLALAAALESESEHPIATGVNQKAKELNLAIPKVAKLQSITGKGIEGEVGGNKISVVSPRYLKELNIAIPSEITELATNVFVLKNEKLLGFISLADEIREESFSAIKEFKNICIKVIMATGDNNKVAKVVSDKLELDGFFAEVLPDGKQKIIKDLQAKGEFVAMAGDGVNDAPALAQADIGIAVGSGTDVAAETADIILVNSSPKDILALIKLGKATYRKMQENLFIATAYNLVTIPLAAGVLYSVGFVMSPALGAVLMSLSTIIVAINAQLLKKKY
jgi:Cu2+-exporting ATPase